MRLTPALVLLTACGGSAPVTVPDAADASIAEVAADVPGDGSIFCDLDCDDKNPCTSDICYLKVGCTHIPHAGKCDDGNPCTTGDQCSGGACAGVCLPGACTGGC